MQATLASGSRVLDILDEEPVVVERVDGVDVSFDGAEACNIDFSYDDERILEDVSVEVRSGEILGIVGKSGSGKSTLCRLFMRFWDPDSGEVRMSGEDLRGVNTASLRDNEALVEQDTFLFHDTIRDNLLIAKPDADQSQIEAACKAASIHDFIQTLPKGYDTMVAGDGGKALELYRSFRPDLVLLDIMLPVMDGWAVCAKIRETDKTPIIMLTAKGETIDKVSGLEMGADDYIVKPFEMKELLARVHAVLRRLGEEPGKTKRLSFDGLVIDLDSYELEVRGKRIDTPPKELELLFHLASSPNRVFTRNQLLDEVWGFDYFGDSRTVDVHIKRLREKLEGVSDQWSLKTVWGVGYKFELHSKS